MPTSSVPGFSVVEGPTEPVKPSSVPGFSVVEGPAASEKPSTVPGFSVVEDAEEESPPEEGTAFKSLPITDQEVELIAKKHGLKPEEMDSLRDHMIWRGAMLSSTTGVGQEVKSIAGALSSDILGNIPQKIAAMQESKPMQEAIDEADELIHSKRSWSEAAAGFAGGLLLPGTALGKAATAVKSVPKAMALMGAEGALMGGLAGFGESKTGEELTSTAIGAGLGAGLGASLHGVVSTIKGVNHGKLQKLIDEEAAKPNVLSKIDTEMASEETELLQHTVAILSEVPTKEEGGVKIGKYIRDAIQMDDDFAEKVINYAEKTYGSASSEDIERAVVHLEGEVKDFGKSLIKAEGEGKVTSDKIIEQLGKTEGNVLDEQFTKWRRESIVEGRLADELQQDLIKETGGKHRGSLGLTTPLKAARYVAAQIDRRLPGLNVTGLIDDYSMQSKRSTLFVKYFKDAFNDINERLIKETGGDEAQMSALYHAMEKGNEALSALPENLQTIAKDYSKVWEEARQAANKEAGHELFAKAENYVHRKAVSRIDGIARIDNEIEYFKSKGLDLINLDASSAKNEISSFIKEADKPAVEKKRLESLLRSVDFFAGQEQTPSIKAFDALKFRENYQRTVHPPQADMAIEGIRARASMERTGDIPMLIRETRMPKLVQAWTRDAARAAFLDSTVSELQHARNMTMKLMDTHSSKYLTDLIADLSGGRKDTLSGTIRQATEEQQIKLIRESLKYPKDSFQRKAYEFSAQYPRFINGLLQQCYPSFLGLHNPAAAVTNLVSPLFTTLPEVGWNYGAVKVLKAYFDVPFIRTGKLKGILEQAGFKGAEWSTDIASELGDPLSQGALKVGKDLIEKYNSFMMSAFSASENINIYVGMHVGDSIAKDLFAGKNADDVAHFLSRLQEGVRTRVLSAYKAGNQEAVSRILQQHMIAKTVLNYDRANMASFARAGGPMFSMFTRWPTAVTGDMLEQFQMKGVVGGSTEILRKYIAPLVMLSIVNEYADKDSDIRRFLVGGGSEGFVRWAPITSIKGMAEGKFASPPILQPLKALPAAISGDMDKTAMTFIRSVEGFVPLATPIHKAIDFATE